MTTLIPPELVHVGLSAADREELFTTMAARLEGLGHVRGTFLQGLLVRESRFPTGLPINGGVAIPHTDPEHVLSSCISIATLARPVMFGQMGGEDETIPVRLVLMLALRGSDDHLAVLKKMMTSLQDGAFVGALLASASAEDIAARARAALEP
ncbi:PTS sugar transporter subunit IIA [uncultured Propionibacterium sp.]|uniref:PTS sugar transporter subunit IIA n=1 Tax=uncultured Propionibacterium sp. TaxID=218066 RepID=UPI00292F807C|nr:PTS sugar transporter subunit IIA [uncultured Propionibacterium sp.]